MNKIISLTTPEIAEHAKCFLDTQRQFASKWGYSYHCHVDKIWDMAASFSKVPALNQAIAESVDGEIVIWYDADVAVLRWDKDFGDLVRKPDIFHSALTQKNWASWRYLCGGIFVTRVCDGLRDYMAQWTDYCLNGVPNVEPGKRVMMRDFPWEQYAADQLNRDTNFKGIHCANNDELGCFCPDLWHDGCIYEPGMPIMHFATGDWARRAEIFKTKYASHVTG